MTQRDVPKVATPLSGLELARALREGHVMWCASAPSDARLAVAWAHVAHETGQGATMTNYNHGHLTPGASWAGDVYLWGLVAEPVVRVPMRFRSYDTAADGAADYWRFLAGGRHAPALVAFDAKDAYAAALSLRESGWYTSSAIPYAASMVSLAEKTRRDVLPALHELVDGDPATAGRWFALADVVRRGG